MIIVAAWTMRLVYGGLRVTFSNLMSKGQIWEFNMRAAVFAGSVDHDVEAAAARAQILPEASIELPFSTLR